MLFRSGVAGTTGIAGDAGGAGIAGASGGAGTGSGADAAASAPYPLGCGSTVKNKAACSTATDLSCANACGPNKSGFKNCNCYSDVWSCPKCEYLPVGDYACYKLPAPLTACPLDPDPSGLPQVGTTCTVPACTPCGSSTLISYRDSGGSSKVGYCVCVPGADGSKWSCASVTEWPPQQ